MVSDSIKISDIENHFLANVDKSLDEYQYIEVLKYYLDNAKGTIISFTKLMNTGITTYLKLQSDNDSKRSKVDRREKYSRIENVPEFMEERRLEGYKEDTLNVDGEDAQKLKAELLEKVRQLRTSKNNSNNQGDLIE